MALYCHLVDSGGGKFFFLNTLHATLSTYEMYSSKHNFTRNVQNGNNIYKTLAIDSKTLLVLSGSLMK